MNSGCKDASEWLKPCVTMVATPISWGISPITMVGNPTTNRTQFSGKWTGINHQTLEVYFLGQPREGAHQQTWAY